MLPEQPALGCLPDILAEAASADAASWWRMSVESQTDKKQELCPCVSSLLQIKRSDNRLGVCVCMCAFTQGRPVGVVVPECSSQLEEVTG